MMMMKIGAELAAVVCQYRHWSDDPHGTALQSAVTTRVLSLHSFGPHTQSLGRQTNVQL